ncbi:MAG: hypothetical protein RJA22_2855 [Verrucomicrobiota bacterium]
MLYPLTFDPIFMKRLWGGRNLERLYGKALPPDQLIGESWEISDRPDAQSVVNHGPLAGRSLAWLMEHHRQEILGPRGAATGPFPLLIKILDAEQTLSVQVHPPAHLAPKLNGQPKTEMWYIASARPDACLYAGLKHGTTREEFERRLGNGSVEACLHRIPVREGDAMFLPSGRCHAIGGGNVIFEIQQNSDTTYRVFDWNRVEADGKPRALHIPESLASIDFADYEPELIQSKYSRNLSLSLRYLVDDPLFRVGAWRAAKGERFHLNSDAFQIVGVLHGRLHLAHDAHPVTLNPGQFALIPACLNRVTVETPVKSEFLHAQIP